MSYPTRSLERVKCTGLVIDRQRVLVGGTTVINWHDNPSIRLAPRLRFPRSTWVRSVYLHTTKGIPYADNKRPQSIQPGAGTGGPAMNTIAYWNDLSGDDYGGSHLIVDRDGAVYCLADLVREGTYHATSANEVSIGIEIWQASDASMFEEQLRAAANVVDTITLELGIQRQTHGPYSGAIPRLARGGRDCVGVFGHRDQTRRRGPGDPGDAIMNVLRSRGYEEFNFGADADLRVWRERQRDVGTTADGIPGPATVRALENEGYARGLWALGQENAAEVRRVAIWGTLDDLHDKHGDVAYQEVLSWLHAQGAC